MVILCAVCKRVYSVWQLCVDGRKLCLQCGKECIVCQLCVDGR
jgi:hypothetical protein